jgi:hypothetical protein
MAKEYLGDGAYVNFDGYSLILTAENGIRATDTIVLEPNVWLALVAYVERLASEATHGTDKDV